MRDVLLDGTPTRWSTPSLPCVPASPVRSAVTAPASCPARSPRSTFSDLPGGRDAEHDVASVGQATDLPGKDLGIAVVIGDRGHRRCVSIESDRGKRLALAASLPEKLGGKMAGLGRAAAVAEGDDLITVSERLADRVAKCLDRGKHIREPARALEMLVEHLAQPSRNH